MTVVDRLLFQRLHTTALIPKRNMRGDAGWDLHAHIDAPVVIAPWTRAKIPTGIACATPEGTYAQIAPRSGLADKHGIDTMAGIVDRTYRDEIKVILVNLSDTPFTVQPGDRVAQMIVVRIMEEDAEEVEALPPSERGTKGFGSSGR